MTLRLDCIASPAARATLAGLGRTEDLVYAPSGRRLAIAGYAANRIAVFDVAVVASNAGRKVFLSDVVEFEAETLRHPHGLCFLDEATVAVANRTGGLQLFAVPYAEREPGPRRAEPRRTITGGGNAPITTPGSVSVFPLGRDALELLVCNNYSHLVTRHVLDRRQGWASVRDDVLLRRGLDVPDGICHSADGAWIAVSNHNTHEVLLFRRTPALGPEAAPDGVLRNVICPHGLRFTRDQRHVLVADAHARYVNVYERGAAGWAGVHDPVHMAPVLDRATYLQGRSNPEEGGPKGIDIDARMGVVACTTQFQTLAFFDLAPMLSRSARAPNRYARHVAWRLAHAIHRLRPQVYAWLRPLWN